MVDFQIYHDKDKLSQFENINLEIFITKENLTKDDLLSKLDNITSRYELKGINSKENDKLNIGDKIELNVYEDKMDDIINSIGYINDNNNYTLKILVKNEK